MQHRVGVAIQPAGMEQRQHGEQHRRRRDIGRAAEIDAIPERHAVGDDGALGLAGGARGVHDGRDVIERHAFAPGRAARRPRSPPHRSRRRRAEASTGSGRAWRPRARCRLRSASWIISFGAASPTMNCSSGTVRRVFSGRNTAPIRPQANCTSSVSVVFMRQHRDPVAARHLEPVAQMRGETRNPRVELRVGEAGDRWRGRQPPVCPASAGRNGRSSRSSEPANSPPRSAVFTPPVLSMPCVAHQHAELRADWPAEVLGVSRRPASSDGGIGTLSCVELAGLWPDRPGRPATRRK